MSKLLVTGSAGFIGFHVALYFLNKGMNVTGIDSFNDYYPVALKKMRNDVLESYDNFTSLPMDIADTANCTSTIADGDFTCICHLAAQAGVRYSLIDPITYVSSNLVGFVNILEGVRHNKKKPRLVYASSSSVYGGNTTLPFKEDAAVDTPISFYAATKKANELMAHTYSHLYGMETTGLRFFTVYGEFCRPDMMLWKFTEAIHYDEPIYLYNEGKQERSFTYIDDIVSGISSAMFAPKSSMYEIFNLGNNHREKLIDVVATLENAMKKKAIIELAPLQPGDMTTTWADITKASITLDFKPVTSFKDCVEIFVRWYKANPEAAQIVHQWRKSSSHT
jgi:UDP-glucuronate 4-epimerase